MTIRPCVRARSASFVLVLSLAMASAGGAQCPNGTPPPCEAPRAVAARTTNLPLDERSWIVVPFDNASHGADTEWLRDASVNLLYLDLSRWNDIHVVDDKRVADFIRQVPGASASQKLSLNDGLAVARRAGAGRLVMGDVLKVGTRTMVTATVFDVRRASRLRSAREETALQDSLIPLFSRLARGILAVAPPAGANLGAIGTSSVSAFQEYLAGVQALNRFELPAAKRHLTRALQLDTNFALAHYKLAVAGSYDDADAALRVSQVSLSDTLTMQRMITSYLAADAASLSKIVDDPASLAHAISAARMSGGLPVRERTLINGLVAQTKKDFARACDIYGGLVRVDSSDVEALYGLGKCLYQDEQVEPAVSDTTQLRFRTSWNAALRVLRSVVRIDPSFHLAFDDVVSILTAPRRLGCRRADAAVPCNYESATGYRAVVRRVGDSLLVVPVPAESRALSRQLAEAERTRSRGRNLEEARRAAEEWVGAAPREWRAHKTLSHVLIRLGRLDEADAALAEAMTDPSWRNDPSVAYLRLNLLAKRHRGRELIPILDTLLVEWPPGFARAAMGAWNSVTGRLAVYDEFGGQILRALMLPPPMVKFGLATARVTLGVADDSTAAAESQVLAVLPGGCNALCVTVILPTLKFGLRLPRDRWPALDSAGAFARVPAALAMSRGDTAGLRAAARRLDSLSRLAAQSGIAEDGTSAIAADALLLVGDSLAALNAVRRMLDTTLVITPLETILSEGGLQIAGMLWPRGMLQRADLAAALNYKDEARLWYGRFVELWAKADPPFQPTVARARRAYISLGGR